MSGKVLHIVNKWENGGVERYVETIVGGSKLWGFEVAVASVRTGIGAEVGCRTYGPLLGSDASVKKAASSVKELIEDLKPDIVHIHTNNGTGFDYARAAKAAGARVRIVHSHNSAFDAKNRLAKRIYTDLARFCGMNDVTHAWACSKAAGEHLFARKPFVVMKNGIDTRRFAFSSELRSDVRMQLGISADAPVLGFAARLTEVKNPLFAFEIFSAFRKLHRDAHFIVLGEGPLAEDLRKLIASRGLSDCCSMLGHQSAPEQYYSAMDVLIAPSLYEGLPINLVEAQANGLVVLASDCITDEVKLRGKAYRTRSLTDQPEKWCVGVDELIKLASDSRSCAWGEVKNAGYDACDTMASIFEEYSKEVVL